MPPSEYLYILKSPEGLLCSTRELNIQVDSEEAIIHLLNLFLELFGELQIVAPTLQSAATTRFRRLDWKILPPGQYPFARAMRELAGYMEQLPEGERPVISERLKVITQFNPDFAAVGLGGFRDYVVFGFTAENLYILESPSLGNATYVFDQDWQELSTKTKKEILDGSLHEARIIHNARWGATIRSMISRKRTGK